MNKAETPRWIQDKHFNEVLFCEDFLAAYPMVCVSGSFFTVDGRITDEESIRKQIYEMLRPHFSCGLAKRASGLLEMLKLEAYFAEALDFIKQNQKPETIISAVVHMDEKTPHMHLSFVPLTEDGRLSAKEIVGNKKKLTQWQDRFWEHMVKKYPDLERGESASETGRDHIPPRLFKEAVHLNRMKEQIMAILNDTNPFNKKAKLDELEALLGKYVPGAEALRTKLKKYDAAYKALTAENAALEKQLGAASKESVLKKLEINEKLRELDELHRMVDVLPPEILQAAKQVAAHKPQER